MTNDPTESRISHENGGSLVKLVLVVVVIAALGILFGVIAAGSLKPRYTPLIGQRMELSQLEFGMARAASELGGGAYPPTDPEAMKVYWKQAFPKAAGGPPPDASDPSKALVFWLSGPNGTTPLFDFDLTRLSGGQYFSKSSGGPGTSSDPYLYFAPPYGRGWGKAGPYKDANGAWINPRMCQILSPGLDGKFGSNDLFPPGPDCDQDSLDDMSNFCQGTMRDARQ